MRGRVSRPGWALPRTALGLAGVLALQGWLLGSAPAGAQELPRPITRPCTHPCINQIIFRNAPMLDQLLLHARVVPGTSILPSDETVTIELSNASSIIFLVTLSPGQIAEPTMNRFLFRDPTARRLGGLGRLSFTERHDADGGFRVDVVAYGDFSSTATLASMTLKIVVGDDPFHITTTWDQKSYGWAVDFPV